MVDTALYTDLLIIGLLVGMFLRSHFKGEEVHDRLDDVIQGVGHIAQSTHQKLDDLMSKGSAAIELHNHNPLEQIFSFISQMKNGTFSPSNITNPRDSHGQYATTREEEQIQETPEIVDITD